MYKHPIKKHLQNSHTSTLSTLTSGPAKKEVNNGKTLNLFLPPYCIMKLFVLHCWFCLFFDFSQCQRCFHVKPKTKHLILNVTPQSRCLVLPQLPWIRFNGMQRHPQNTEPWDVGTNKNKKNCCKWRDSILQIMSIRVPDSILIEYSWSACFVYPLGASTLKASTLIEFWHAVMLV